MVNCLRFRCHSTWNRMCKPGNKNRIKSKVKKT